MSEGSRAAPDVHAENGEVEPGVVVASAIENAEQLQQRIVAFSEAFPKIERLYTKFNRFVKVDASIDSEMLYEGLRDSLQSTLDLVCINVIYCTVISVLTL